MKFSQVELSGPGAASRFRFGLVTAGWAAMVAFAAFFSGEWNGWAVSVISIMVFLLLFFSFRLIDAPATFARLRLPLLALAVFLLLFLASAATSSLLATALRQWLIMLVYALVFCLGIAFQRLDPEHRWLTSILVTVGVVLSVQAMIHDLPHGLSRFAGSLANANAFGGFLVIPISLAMARALGTSAKRRWLWIGAALICLTALILTFSFTSWLALALAVGVGIFLLPHGSLRRVTTIVWLSGALIGALFVVSTALPKLSQRIPAPISAKHLQFSFQQRAEFNFAALRMVRSRPLLGFGPGAFQQVFPRFTSNFSEQPRYAHNDYIQFFADGGLLSGTMFLVFFALLARVIVPPLRHSTPSIITVGLLVAVVASAINAGVDFSWHFPLVAVAFWTCLGVLAASGASSRSDAPRPARAIPVAVLALAGVTLLFGSSLAAATMFVDRAKILQGRGDIAGAQTAWLQAARFDPQPSTFREYALNAYRNQSVPAWADDALASAHHAQWWGRDDYFTAHLLGQIALAQNDLVQAESELRRSVALDPGFHLNFFHDLLFALNGQGKSDEAIAVGQAALDRTGSIEIRSNPSYVSDWSKLAVLVGELEEKRGSASEAEKYYKRALEIAPGDPQATADLERVTQSRQQ